MTAIVTQSANDPSFAMAPTLKVVLVVIGLICVAIVLNALGTLATELFTHLFAAAKPVAQEAVVSAFRVPPTV